MDASHEMKPMSGNGETTDLVEEIVSPGLEEQSTRFKSTYEDNRDMFRMNKKQELR